jgi:uncharacterized membrane protein required for colicin V production
MPEVILDGLILIVVGAGVAVGFRRGAIQPLLAEVGFLGVGSGIFLSHWAGYETILGHLHLPGIVGTLPALALASAAGYAGWRVGDTIHKMPMVQGIDGLLGMLVNGLVAVVLCYSLLSTLIGLMKAFGPISDTAAVSLNQVITIRQQVEANPLLAALASQSELDNLVASARQPGAHSVVAMPSSLLTLDRLYSDTVQPQLYSSRLTPAVLGIGQRVPGVGHFGPKDIVKVPAR